MRTIKIGFSKPKSKLAILSYLIRLVENSKFSHAFLRWNSPSIERDLIYQSSKSFVHFISGNKFDEDEITVVQYALDVTDDQFNSVVQKCVDLAGTSYGLLTLVGIGIHKLFGIKNQFKDGERSFICSELVGDLLRSTLKENLEIDLETAGPRELEEQISKIPGIRRII